MTGQSAKNKSQVQVALDETWQLNEYRIKGTFAYLAYCHTYDTDLEECSSFSECEGHERIKTVDILEDAHSEKEAEQVAIEEYRDNYSEATWLLGQPEVIYVRSVAERELQVSAFWQSELPERRAIQTALQLRQLNEIAETDSSTKKAEP